jgi:Ser/Thr protein kinase RdoA (MazF antagonist)
VNEVRLTGGRVTEGVVRVGDTVRRPARESAGFVRALLEHLAAQGFSGAPRHLGRDELGREVLSFVPGRVPAELDAAIPDGALEAAAGLIRRFHDATAGSELAGAGEVVCHNDLSPCNFVFRDGLPVALIDFDAAAPGDRLQDVGYALFLWLNLGTNGPPPVSQARRIGVFCRSYCIAADEIVIDAIVAAVATNTERLIRAGRDVDAAWWQGQLRWLELHRSELEGALSS